MVDNIILTAASASLPILAAAIMVPAPAAAQTHDAASAAAAPARAPVVRAGTEQWDVTSKISGRTYRIYVSKPAETLPPPPGGYPVVYLTDADYIFHTAADSLPMLSIGMQAKPAIIVGIGYGKGIDAATLARFTDLTSTPPGAAMAPYLKNTPSFMGSNRVHEAHPRNSQTFTASDENFSRARSCARARPISRLLEISLSALG